MKIVGWWEREKYTCIAYKGIWTYEFPCLKPEQITEPQTEGFTWFYTGCF